jgi:hypothetical protein
VSAADDPVKKKPGRGRTGRPFGNTSGSR